MTVDLSPLRRALGGRLARNVPAHAIRTAFAQMIRLHGLLGDTPGQFAFVSDMLEQCPVDDEQLRVLCMRAVRIICVVHEQCISNCLLADYGIGRDVETEAAN